MESIGFGHSKLTKVTTSKATHLKMGLPREAFQCLKSLIVQSDWDVENLSEVEEVFCGCCSSLQELEIKTCIGLKSVCGRLEHLTVLESLELLQLPNLSLSEEGDQGEEEDGLPWRCLHHSLHYLELSYLPKLVKLPKGMRYLTAHQSLKIIYCPQLESVPEWMPGLTSLKQLEILGCSFGLRERCHNPTGEDWPNIQYIPDRNIS